MNPIFLEYPILFLQRATSYDGGDEGGSSIFDIFRFFESLGENSWWIFVGIVLLILMVKSILKGIFIDNPREREYHRKFNSDYPTIENKQRYYDKRFSTEKLEVEKKWEKESGRSEFDLTNKAHYSRQISRSVVKVDYSSEKGYKLLTEYWTYDGEWRQGYWTGNYDYKDWNWNRNTKCDVIDLTVGDIQPKITKITESNRENLNKKKTSQENSKHPFDKDYNELDGDDLPF